MFAFPRLQWFREDASVLRYKYIASLVLYLINQTLRSSLRVKYDVPQPSKILIIKDRKPGECRTSETGTSVVYSLPLTMCSCDQWAERIVVWTNNWSMENPCTYIFHVTIFNLSTSLCDYITINPQQVRAFSPWFPTIYGTQFLLYAIR